MFWCYGTEEPEFRVANDRPPFVKEMACYGYDFICFLGMTAHSLCWEWLPLFTGMTDLCVSGFLLICFPVTTNDLGVRVEKCSTWVMFPFCDIRYGLGKFSNTLPEKLERWEGRTRRCSVLREQVLSVSIVFHDETRALTRTHSTSQMFGHTL